MMLVPSFSDASIESIAICLGDCGTGSEITRFLERCGISDRSGQSTKWRRLYWVFTESQRQYGCANKAIEFIQAFLAPERFVGSNPEFEENRSRLNTILAFSGLEYGADGKFRYRPTATTLREAEQRVSSIRAKFEGRRLHPEVLKYCKAELMQSNYFHAVFEASKGLSQRIRDKSGMDGDGATLIDVVFSVRKPILALNRLQTETEKSEHKGFATLLKGCFATVRNPIAHEPKIMRNDEDDAADYFSLISLLHRKLDDCFPTGLGNGI